jgi:hypothetical protein
VLIGGFVDRTFEIANLGDSTLTGTVSEDCDHYTIISGFGPYELPPGYVRGVTVRYEPTAEGLHDCVIDTGDPACEDVSCTGWGYFHDPGPSDIEGGWALHIAGPHNSKANTCDFVISGCDQINVTEEVTGVRYDIYVIGTEVHKVQGTRFGLDCVNGVPFFYGWTNCGDFEIPTPGWPACDGGNAITWSAPQDGPYVTVGILDAYIYPGPATRLEMTVDPRSFGAEWCDGQQPSPNCWVTDLYDYFGAAGFGTDGYRPCPTGYPVPVALQRFEALSTNEGILLEWSLSSHSNSGRFFIHRSVEARDGDYVLLADGPVGVDEATGLYSYLDDDVIAGTLYYYKLELSQLGGESVIFGPYPVLASNEMARYSLDQNVPNPFMRGGRTVIHYSVGKAGSVEIRIIDAAGRLIRTLSDQAAVGRNQITWDGTDERGTQVSAGVYFYQFSCGEFNSQRKLMLVE